MPTLREVRERQYLTQEELAAKAGITKSTVATIEKGTHRPRLRTVRQLAEVLGISPEEITWPAGNGKITGD
jgi:transcriptional regulator with XRE-family HTH domain